MGWAWMGCLEGQVVWTLMRLGTLGWVLRLRQAARGGAEWAVVSCRLPHHGYGAGAACSGLLVQCMLSGAELSEISLLEGGLVCSFNSGWALEEGQGCSGTHERACAWWWRGAEMCESAGMG